MLPHIAPSKSPSTRAWTASIRDPAQPPFEKAAAAASPSPSPLHSSAAINSPSARASPAISAIMKTPAVSANFAVFASPERRQRIDVQAMLNEIHSRPSMSGLLGTGIVSALSAKTFTDTQTNKPLEVRANLDRFIRSKLQEVCTVKDDIIQNLGEKLSAMTTETVRLERALSDEQSVYESKLADLEDRLNDAMLARRRSMDEEGGDMSPNFSPHPLKHPLAAASAEHDMTVNLNDGDKDALFAHMGIAARCRSTDQEAYAHAHGAALAPQVGLVAPVIAETIEQLHKGRRPQRPIEASVIVTHAGDIAEMSVVEQQRQSLRRRMTKSSKATDAIECTAKALMNIIAFEDVSHGGGSDQPRRPALAAATTSSTGTPLVSATASGLTASRRGSVLGAQTGKRLVASSGGEEPLPIDLFLENQQRADFISHVTAAITLLPPNTCQDFVAEIMRQASCFGAGLAVASEAIAILSVGDTTSNLFVQAAKSLQRVCRVQRVQLYEIHWDSHSLVPIVSGNIQERDDLGVSQRIPIGQGYAGKCVSMGPQVVNFPASLGQDFQPTDRGEGAIASTMLAIPIGLPGQPPVMVATLINKLLPLGTPQQQQLDAMLKGKSDGASFGSLPPRRAPPANADKPPFTDADVVVSSAVAYFIAQKAVKCRLACCMGRLRSGMMARAYAMGGGGVGGEGVLSCVRSQELCAAILSDMRAAANWTCIDMFMVIPGPPMLLGKATGVESCILKGEDESHVKNNWGKINLIVHVVRDDVSASTAATAATLPSSSTPTRLVTKPVSEASLSQLQAQLATQLLPHNCRRAATLEVKSLLQTQSHLLNQIVCVTVSEGVFPTEVGTDYAVVQNLDRVETGAAPNSDVQTLPLTDVNEIVRYACADAARGLALCSAQGQALFSSFDPASNRWTLRYEDSRFNPNSRIFSKMDASSCGVASIAKAFSTGASYGRQCMFMPVMGAGGAVVAVLRAEKNVKIPAGGTNSAHNSLFSDDEIFALDCVGQHCGSILQAGNIRLQEVSRKTIQGVIVPELTTPKRPSAVASEMSGLSNVITPSWCVRSIHEKQRLHMEDICLKACMSLQCSKVSILLLVKDRHWLIQLSHATLHKMQSGVVLSDQGDAANVYEGYKHNGIAQLAISSGESVMVHNVNVHAGYDSSLDAMAGILGRNCLAAPITTADPRSNLCCVGVLFATNKLHGSFFGSDAVMAGAFADSVASALAGLLEKIPQLRTLDEAKPTPVTRSEGEMNEVEEMRAVLNAL